MKTWLRWSALLALWLLAQGGAEAHGGDFIINETRGNYLVAAQLSPAPMSVGRGDLSIAVRDAANNYQPLPVQDVIVILRDANDTATAYPAAAEGAPEDAIYGSHTLDFTSAGTWQLTVRFNDGAAVEEWTTTVAVASGAWRWLNVVLYFAPLLVLLVLVAVASIRNRRMQQDPALLVETKTDAN